MTFSALLFCVFLRWPAVSLAFQGHSSFLCQSRRLDIRSALRYQNDDGDGGTDNSKQGTSSAAAAPQTIPVLGPIPNQGPLLLGAELTLDPPTPFQWQTIHHAVEQHERYLQQQQKQHQQEGEEPNHGNIDAAPLVAIMDSVTSSSGSNTGPPPRGRYATIAAVVGMSTSSASSDQPQGLDLTDSATFRESLDQMVRRNDSGNTNNKPWESRIRLVGVGRATLSNFFHRLPEDDLDADGYISTVQKSILVGRMGRSYQQKSREDDDRYDGGLDEINDEDIDDDRMNLVMAHFFVVTDGVDRTLDFQKRGRDGRRGIHRTALASPVHHVSELASWARKLDYLHQDRRRLVAGLQAATARLELAEQQQQSPTHQQLDAVEGEWEDYDGLGMVTASRFGGHEEREAAQSAVEDILQFAPTEDASSLSTLQSLENYGMGYSSVSFSTLPQVTDVWLEKLAPFYSPRLRETEEYYYEILSFVAVLSLDKFLSEADFGWSLMCSNTLERMEQVYSWMWDHVRLLEAEASRASAKLRDCGEECTDLW